jgi:predicted RNase H-like nuclease (RuvC/YqgF family)
MDLEKSLNSLHGRLNSMQDEFQRDLSLLIGELEGALNAAGRLGSVAASTDERVRRLEARTEGQMSVIETLSQEAEESHGLRSKVRERDLEIARLTRELDSKNELIRALRRQLDAGRAPLSRAEAEAG